MSTTYLALSGMGSFLASYDALEGRCFDQRVVAARGVDRRGERDGGENSERWEREQRRASEP